MSAAGAWPLLQLGFRVFFLLAGLFALLAMGAWAGTWAAGWHFGAVPAVQWHAHEMIYGYALAVVAGFLLTAVPNWTGQTTPRGKRLAALAALWIVARILLAASPGLLGLAMCFDLAFGVCLLVAVARPIIAVRQWRQSGIVAKLALLLIGNGLFYLGVLGVWLPGVHIALHGGVLLLIALILTIAGRVVPGFMTRGLNLPVAIHDPRGASGMTLVLFAAFFIAELGAFDGRIPGALAAALALVTTRRLVAWYAPSLWRAPLLWGLFAAVVAIDAGFVLYALAGWFPVPRTLALHAFAAGGIALATLSMMVRVSIGHTGRDIRHPPAALTPALCLLVAAVVARVVLPLALPQWYAELVFVAQVFWIAAFALFLAACTPMWWHARLDAPRP